MDEPFFRNEGAWVYWAGITAQQQSVWTDECPVESITVFCVAFLSPGLDAKVSV
jgi:hypothetical protein